MSVRRPWEVEGTGRPPLVPDDSPLWKLLVPRPKDAPTKITFPEDRMTTDPTGHATPEPARMAEIRSEVEASAEPYGFPPSRLDAGALAVENARLRERAAAATEARDRLAGEVERLAVEMQRAADFTAKAGAWSKKIVDIYDRHAAKLRRILAATAPPAAPSEPAPVGEGAALIAATQQEINALDDMSMEAATYHDRIADKWESTARILARALDARPAAGGGSPDCCSYPTPKAYEQAAARTAGDEHLQALRDERDEANRHREQQAKKLNEQGHYLAILAKGLPERGFPPVWDLATDALAAIDTLRQERDEAERARGDAHQFALDEASRHRVAVAEIQSLTADLAEARQEAERLRGGITRILESRIIHPSDHVNPDQRHLANVARLSQLGDRLRALASTGGSDTTGGNGG